MPSASDLVGVECADSADDFDVENTCSGIKHDPLFSEPDPLGIVRAIISCAGELERCWSRVIREIEADKSFAVPAFQEEAQPSPIFAERADRSVMMSESEYIERAARESGREVSALGEAELSLLRRSYAEDRSYLKQVIPVSGEIPELVSAPETFRRVNMQERIAEPSV